MQTVLPEMTLPRGASRALICLRCGRRILVQDQLPSIASWRYMNRRHQTPTDINRPSGKKCRGTVAFRILVTTPSALNHMLIQYLEMNELGLAWELPAIEYRPS